MALIIFIITFIIISFLISNNKEHFYSPRINTLGPSINGLNNQDDAFQTDYAQNIDPFSINVKNNNLLLSSYNNNMNKNFNNNNIRESIIHASIKQILNDTKNILNSNNTPIKFDIVNLNNNNININTDVFNPIIYTIFNSFNSIANKTLSIKPVNVAEYNVIFNSLSSTYIIDCVIKIDVSHPLDNMLKKIKNNLSLIIKFTVSKKSTYINDLSVINI